MTTSGEEKALQKIDARYNVAEHFITRNGELLEHIAARISFTISSFFNITVTITSVIPEGMAVAQASGNIWFGIASSVASAAGVFVAMQKPFFWIVYLFQLLISLEVVRRFGTELDAFGPLVSFLGALIGSGGASLIASKASELKSEKRADEDADFDRKIKLMQVQSRLRNNETRTNAKYRAENSTVQAAENTTNSHRNNDQNLINDKGREKSKKVRGKKAQARLDEMHRFILDEYDGVPVKELTATQIKQKMKLTVSDSTVRNDLAELRKTKLNGTVRA